MKLLVFLISMSLSIICPAATDSGTEEDHAQLRDLLTKATEAVNTDHPEILDALLHPDHVITVMDQEVVSADKTVRQLFDEWFKNPDSPLKSLQIKPTATIRTNIYDGRFGVCYGTSVDLFKLRDGRSIQFDSKWTATLIKEDGRWKLLALHVGVNPIENELIDGYRSGLGFGGVGIELKRLFD